MAELLMYMAVTAGLVLFAVFVREVRSRSERPGLGAYAVESASHGHADTGVRAPD